MVDVEGLPPEGREKYAHASAIAKTVLGFSEAEAMTLLRQAGLEQRVVRRDGHRLPGRRDFRFNRVNLSVAAGIVEDAQAG